MSACRDAAADAGVGLLIRKIRPGTVDMTVALP
jgi:hypothetical protein